LKEVVRERIDGVRLADEMEKRGPWERDEV
jgi:hypothetical protein